MTWNFWIIVVLNGMMLDGDGVELPGSDSICESNVCCSSSETINLNLFLSFLLCVFGIVGGGSKIDFVGTC